MATLYFQQKLTARIEIFSESVILILVFIIVAHFYTVSQNDTDLPHYNYNTHQEILVIFGRDAIERVCYRMVICYPFF